MDKKFKFVLKNAHDYKYKYYIIGLLTIVLLFIIGYIYYNYLQNSNSSNSSNNSIIKYQLKDKFLIEDNLPSFRYEAGTFDTWTVPPGATQATFTVVGGSGSSVSSASACSASTAAACIAARSAIYFRGVKDFILRTIN